MRWLIPTLYCIVCLTVPPVLGRVKSWLSFNYLFLLFFFLIIFFGVHILDYTGVYPEISVNWKCYFIIYLLPFLFCLSLIFGKEKFGDFGDGYVRTWDGDKVGELFFLIVGCVFLILYIWKNELAITAIIKGDIIEVYTRRAEAHMWISNSLLYRIYLLFARYGIQFIAIFEFAEYLVKRRNKIKLLLIMAMALFVIVSDGQKYPIFLFLFQIYMVRAIIKKRMEVEKDKSWKWIKTLVVVSIAFVSMCLIYYFVVPNARKAADSGEYSTIMQMVLDRSVLGHAKPLAVITSDFPDKINYLFGKTMSDFGILPFDQFDLSSYAYHELYRGYEFGGASTVFAGEFYANAGLLAVVILTVAFVLCSRKCEYYLARRCDNTMGVAVYSFIGGVFTNLSSTQIIMGLGLPVAAVILFIFLSTIFRINRKHSVQMQFQCKSNNTIQLIS